MRPMRVKTKTKNVVLNINAFKLRVTHDNWYKSIN